MTSLLSHKPETSSNAVLAIFETLEKQGIKFVRCELPDLHGVPRSKVLPLDQIKTALEKGVNFSSSALAMDTASTTVRESSFYQMFLGEDLLLFPNLKTLASVPWKDKTAKVICDARWSSQKLVEEAPRFVMEQILKMAHELGFDVMLGYEFEFFLLDSQTRQPIFDRRHIFNSIYNQCPAIDQMVSYLQKASYDITTYNCENAPGQFELNYEPSIGVKAADKAYTFKAAIKEIANKQGYLATFMAKPLFSEAGSGLHIHINLIDRKTGQNAFYDPSDPCNLSQTAKHFIQGILEHTPAITPFLNPSVNCYRRLQAGGCVPCSISWGIEDRSALIRIKKTHPESTRIELRAASALSNPYLAGASALAAGLLGLEQKKQLESSIAQNNQPKLPKTLDYALDELETNANIIELLGKNFCKLFIDVKRAESDRFHEQVTDWEKNELMELY